jgi:hypothetical protein
VQPTDLSEFPEPASSEIWNKELRVTGRFLQKINLPKQKAIQAFQVDTAVDEETGEEIESLNDEDIGVISDMQADYDERYQLLLKTGMTGQGSFPRAPGLKIIRTVISYDKDIESLIRLLIYL